MMELIVLIANGFILLTNSAKVPSYMFNKVLNVPLVLLSIVKTKFLKSECYKSWKTITKKLKLCSPQSLPSKKDLKYLTR